MTGKTERGGKQNAAKVSDRMQNGDTAVHGPSMLDFKSVSISGLDMNLYGA